MDWDKWWTVTVYYPLTSVRTGMRAPTGALAKEAVLEVIADELGATKAYKYEDIEVEEQEEHLAS